MADDDETKIIMSQKINRPRAFRLPIVCLPHALTTIGVTLTTARSQAIIPTTNAWTGEHNSAALAYDNSEAFISPLVRADCPLPKTPTPKLP
jgi:hypothetical protein